LCGCYIIPVKLGFFIFHHKVKTTGFSRLALAAIMRVVKGGGHGLQVEYHFVWVTKYWYKVLTGEVADRVRALVRETCEAFEIRIISGVVSRSSDERND
jgi:putative transposase